ncbi:bacterio-opsin activator [Natrarchaeobius oligotrophus]|uniref:Bacterio-opsin activator n=2 Tax=Natrarchaeobius TaxID=2501796 RepID=A0A3N6N5R1_NATCH|nr:bacterio-opsin activator [Natrarchaeobius chitinivorans]
MTVIAEITVPADTFVLGKLFHTIPDAVVEFEPIVPLQSGYKTSLPLVSVSRAEPDEVRTALRDEECVEAVDVIASTEKKTVFEIEWNDGDGDGIVQPLIDIGGRVLKATGRETEWEFHLLFDSHLSLSEFNMAATSNEVPVTLNKVYNSNFQNENTAPAVRKTVLKPSYRETLLLAYRSGYYDAPRSIQLAELAQKENVSDSALSKRLRRATAALIELTLLSDGSVADTTRR